MKSDLFQYRDWPPANLCQVFCLFIFWIVLIAFTAVFCNKISPCHYILHFLVEHCVILTIFCTEGTSPSYSYWYLNVALLILIGLVKKRNTSLMAASVRFCWCILFLSVYTLTDYGSKKPGLVICLLQQIRLYASIQLQTML